MTKLYIIHQGGFFLIKFIMLKRQSPCYTSSTRVNSGGTSPNQTLIKPDPNYKSYISLLSLPLSGGSSRGQAIPACFEHALHYYCQKIFTSKIGKCEKLLLWNLNNSTSALSSEEWVQELINGHLECIRCELEVHKHIFKALIAYLRNIYHSYSWYVTIKEQLFIFLYKCITGLSIRHIGEHFQCSNDTIFQYEYFWHIMRL